MGWNKVIHSSEKTSDLSIHGEFDGQVVICQTPKWEFRSIQMSL